MSISSLAAEIGVADATISRFCKALGYDGYNEFKLALAKSSSLNLNQDADILSDKITEHDSIVELSHKLMAVDVSAIQQTLNLLREDTVHEAACYLLNASKVYCFGQGGSGVIAKEAWARFLTISPKFQCIEDNHMQAIAASMCSPSDVILFFSYSGATKDAMDTLRLAKQQHARTILVTHFSCSPVSTLADIILLCGSRESPLNSGSIAAKMGQLFLIDILFHEYCRQDAEATALNRDMTSNAVVNKLL